jgi:ferrous iron transport protein A
VKSLAPIVDSSIDGSTPLADLRRGEFGVVTRLSSVTTVGDAENSSDALLARLRDLGFVAGARCEVVARMWPKGDPMAVRVGGSTFALRRAEANIIRVQRLQEPALAGTRAALA